MSINRMAEIVKVFAEEGLGFLTARRGEQKVAAGAEASSLSPDALSDRETAIRLRRIFERLGPTFVKFGQILATRVDLFSDDFIQELGKLHSKVPPFDHKIALNLIENELGRPIEQVFEAFPSQPIAAASVAQVYKAKLKTGECVAVKIQRPHLDLSLVQDLQLIVQISGWLDLLVSTYRKSMMHSAAEEYARSARMEMDFKSEAYAIDRFHEILRDDPFFLVPRVFHDLSSEKLIVMEWFDGYKLDQFKNADDLRSHGLEPKLFAENLLRLQICMSYEHGFIHGDTHPGNLIVIRGQQKIGLIDFGLNAVVSKFVQNKMLEALIYQSNGQIDKLVDVMCDLMPPADSGKEEPYKAELRKIIMTWPSADSSMTKAKISDQFTSSIRVGVKYKNRTRPELLVVMRNLSIVEGVILRFQPELRPVAEVKKILIGIMARKLSPRAIDDQLRPLLAEIAMTLYRKPELAQRLMQLERSFLDSPTVGHFLRKEGVISEKSKPKSSLSSLALTFVIGGICGVIVIFLLTK